MRHRSHAASLEEEAVRVHPAVEELRSMHAQGALSDAGLAAAYVVVWAAARSPRGLVCGERDRRVVEDEAELGGGVRLVDLPRLCELMGGAVHLRNKGLEEVTLWQLLNRRHLKSLKQFVNECLVLWQVGQRPALLMHRVPSPIEVLEQQAKGHRVVTVFLERTELAVRHTNQLTYMETGDTDHERDALEFLVHDLKHLENFTDAACHAEQVGFFRALCRLQPNTKAFFEDRFPGDQILWPQLEYVCADMNAYLPHMLKYLLAKLTVAACRNSGVDLLQVWNELLDQFGMDENSAARTVAVKLVQEQKELVLQDFEELRAWFQHIAITV